MKNVSNLLVALLVMVGLICIGNVALGENIVLKGAGCKTEFFLFKDLAPAYNAKTGNKFLPAGVGNKKAVNLLMEQKIDFAFTCNRL